ncbi:hypothetical protein F4821DRAFT_261111 [Hypoxylon rubiginosum]|uniref:Uncharacterized protein n=1 Tax=Hypoxylon rubiginosum TaxID=110542 RepID=A0ACC0CXU1_9PEZI|nr:hypothetical protein F4821DRAFT_261111 [Hypoxylon rubiginosum]
MHHLALKNGIALTIEPAVVQRINVYDTALQLLSQEWTEWTDKGQHFLPQLKSNDGKVEEFIGGFNDAYHLAVMRILMENRRWELVTGDCATARMFQRVLGWPVIFIAPNKRNDLLGQPPEDLPRRLLHSMLCSLLTYFEDIGACERRMFYLTTEDMLEALEKIKPHAWPDAPVYKYLCIVAELDRAVSFDTIPLVRRMIRELERIFVDGGKGDVFYFFDKPWGVNQLLKRIYRPSK